MTTETMSTPVVKNKSTDRDREFWSHVEAVAAQAGRIRALSWQGSSSFASNHEKSQSDTAASKEKASAPSE